MTTSHTVYPVILSGGTGTRLWPLSRAALPKQLLALDGERTMIQDTVLRGQLPGAAPPLLLCSEAHRFLVAEQMQEIGVTPRAIVLEPMGRNTAPAAAVAALMIAQDDAQGVIVLLPSDHVVRDGAAFGEAVALSAEAAREGHIVTFGMQPSAPETGYGYVHRGPRLEKVDGVHRVQRFVEKPDAPTAQTYLDDGGYFWNSGMFVFRADVLIEDMRLHAPDVLAAARAALSAAKRDLDFVRLDAKAFSDSPNISIDYALMEKTDRAAVVPCDIGWSDVGAWSALWDIRARDADGNVLTGDVIAHDSTGSFVHSGRKLIALVGVRDLVVVATDDALLVADKSRAQEVKAVVDRLKADGRSEHTEHKRVFRPWGSYETIDAGDRFQVKHIMVKPGGRLSLQMHHQRAEHWVVVQGTARVTVGDKVSILKENESTFIPLGEKHRLENPGDAPLRLIEVQSGGYLGEDDIVRFEDVYGRAPAAKAGA
ncbi:MAG: mannose-1-phosphate guanylyltransferase/mannose-6-phosphate isomerase [Alphaproteobacteria bacterium]|nr:mannose-1-phosphate guanylyltransferase/mannose-6-phosphate isomerase [Alphaproteobacteria bacterium]MBV9694530.1 mannose-1-phosphate guanylyltransferase/mannose-6-phosphate isomerase [Alphaproteobacteria bacterium]